jgi:hypothetical protein
MIIIRPSPTAKRRKQPIIKKKQATPKANPGRKRERRRTKTPQVNHKLITHQECLPPSSSETFTKEKLGTETKPLAVPPSSLASFLAGFAKYTRPYNQKYVQSQEKKKRRKVRRGSPNHAGSVATGNSSSFLSSGSGVSRRLSTLLFLLHLFRPEKQNTTRHRNITYPLLPPPVIRPLQQKKTSVHAFVRFVRYSSVFVSLPANAPTPNGACSFSYLPSHAYRSWITTPSQRLCSSQTHAVAAITTPRRSARPAASAHRAPPRPRPPPRP